MPADPRIPIIFAALAAVGPTDVAFVEGIDFAPDDGAFRHGAGCSCCSGRPAAAVALGRLFVERARGDRPAFARVVAVVTGDPGRRAVCEAAAHDLVASARFRIEAPPAELIVLGRSA